MKKTIDYTALAETIRTELNASHDRSAWDKAVTLYALDLLEDVQEGANNMERLPLDGAELEQWALNGASCWEQYSNGGCSLCYDSDIAARYSARACNRIRTICRTNGLYCKGVQ